MKQNKDTLKELIEESQTHFHRLDRINAKVCTIRHLLFLAVFELEGDEKQEAIVSALTTIEEISGPHPYRQHREENQKDD